MLWRTHSAQRRPLGAALQMLAPTQPPCWARLDAPSRHVLQVVLHSTAAVKLSAQKCHDVEWHDAVRAHARWILADHTDWRRLTGFFPTAQSGTFAAGMAVGSTLAYVTPHLNGAIDIMAVRQPDGTIKTSPFYGEGLYGPLAACQPACHKWANCQW